MMNKSIISEFTEIDKEQSRLSQGIGAYIEAERFAAAQIRLQSTTALYNRKFDDDQQAEITNIIEYINEKRNRKELDRVNFMNKDTIGEITRETFLNSVYVAKLGRFKMSKPVRKLYSLSGRQGNLIDKMIQRR